MAIRTGVVTRELSKIICHRNLAWNILRAFRPEHVWAYCVSVFFHYRPISRNRDSFAKHIHSEGYRIKSRLASSRCIKPSNLPYNAGPNTLPHPISFHSLRNNGILAAYRVHFNCNIKPALIWPDRHVKWIADKRVKRRANELANSKEWTKIDVIHMMRSFAEYKITSFLCNFFKLLHQLNNYSQFFNLVF